MGFDTVFLSGAGYISVYRCARYIYVGDDFQSEITELVYRRLFPGIDHKNRNGTFEHRSPYRSFASRENAAVAVYLECRMESSLGEKKKKENRKKKIDINRIRLSPRRGALPERKND